MARSKLKAPEIAEMFSRFRLAEPEPKGELHSVNDFTFLVAVVLSAQATDVGVNKATKALFAVADTPAKMEALGVEGLEYRLGGCCSPLPGEAIVGAVALGNHGITIHRQDCANVGQTPSERRLPVRWNPAGPGQQRRYTVRLRIEVLDRVGVLKDILTRLSDHRINVSDARVRTSAGKPARIDLRVELDSASQLASTINQIRSMADVLDIARTGIG